MCFNFSLKKTFMSEKIHSGYYMSDKLQTRIMYLIYQNGCA